jgi:chromosome segregation ATPase
MNRNLAPRIAAALLIVCGGTLAVAPGAIAQNKAEGRTLTLGGSGGAGGPVLTRKELRECLDRQDAIAKARTVLDTDRQALDAEREAIKVEQEQIKADRSKIDETKAAAVSLNQRYKDLNARVEAWNAQRKDAEDRSGPSGDRERRRLERERVDMEKTQAALDAEREKIASGNEAAVNSYNDRATALDGRVKDWNQRNDEIFKRSEKLAAERDLWAGECANRRYREDDEILLKKGAK